MSIESTASPDELARFRDLERRSPASLGALLQVRVAGTPDTEAYRRPDGRGGWRSQTWAETGRVAEEIAAGLLDLGVVREDRIAIMSSTRVEWIEVDLGIMCAGAATTTIYPTSTSDEALHILTDSDSRVAVVEHADHVAKVLAAGSPVSPCRAHRRARTLRRGPGDDPGRAARARPAAADGNADRGHRRHRRGAPRRPRDAHLHLRHHRPVERGPAVTPQLALRGLGQPRVDLVGPDDVGYLWLPFAHSFGKRLLATQLAIGHAAVVDGDVGRIITNLPVVRADADAVGAARLREGARRRHRGRPQGRRGQGPTVRLGDRCRARGGPSPGRRPSAGPVVGRAARGRRPSRVREDPRPLRRPDALHGLRRRQAVRRPRASGSTPSAFPSWRGTG